MGDNKKIINNEIKDLKNKIELLTDN